VTRRPFAQIVPDKISPPPLRACASSPGHAAIIKIIAAVSIEFAFDHSIITTVILLATPSAEDTEPQ
jgi:hypothetical protein